VASLVLVSLSLSPSVYLYRPVALCLVSDVLYTHPHAHRAPRADIINSWCEMAMERYSPLLALRWDLNSSFIVQRGDLLALAGRRRQVQVTRGSSKYHLRVTKQSQSCASYLSYHLLIICTTWWWCSQKITFRRLHRRVLALARRVHVLDEKCFLVAVDYLQRLSMRVPRSDAVSMYSLQTIFATCCIQR